MFGTLGSALYSSAEWSFMAILIALPIAFIAMYAIKATHVPYVQCKYHFTPNVVAIVLAIIGVGIVAYGAYFIAQPYQIVNYHGLCVANEFKNENGITFIAIGLVLLATGIYKAFTKVDVDFATELPPEFEWITGQQPTS